ncbi:ABC transporter permease [Kribbella swartbergensis]
MGAYLVRRLIAMIPTIFLISLVSFLIIQLPPGDFLDTVIANMQTAGQTVQPAEVAALRERYALDQPLLGQYIHWITRIVTRGDFGSSMLYGRPVWDLIAERMPLTLLLGISTVLFGWIVSLPAGIYSAVRRYTVPDYVMTALAFLGIAIPGFLLALTVAFLQFKYGGKAVGGMFSPEYAEADWNLGKLLDFLDHLWLPVLVLSIGGIGGTIRILRANLLDELRKPYVVTARSRGLSERRLIANYPVRVALNPFVATIGWLIPALFDGEVLVATVLGLETTGPLLLRSLESQDMYLAGSIIFIACVLTVIGTLISDILLALIDPRVRAGVV